MPSIYTGDLLFFGRDRGVRISSCCGKWRYVRLGSPRWHAAGLVFSDPDSGRTHVFVVPFAREPPYTEEFYTCMARFFLTGDAHAVVGHRRTSYVHASRVQRNISPGARKSDAETLAGNSVHATKFCHHALVRALFFLDMAPVEWTPETGTVLKKPSAYAKSMQMFLRSSFYPSRWHAMVLHRGKWTVDNSTPDPSPLPPPPPPPPPLPSSSMSSFSVSISTSTSTSTCLPPPPPPMPPGVDIADASVDTDTVLLPPPLPPPPPPQTNSRPQPSGLAATSDPFCI